MYQGIIRRDIVEDRMKNIIFLAAPNGGKGTLSEMLVEKYGYGHISTGDLLRDEVKKKTPLGLEVEEIMQSGNFVSDEIIIKLIENRIQEKDCENGYILDGFPRTIVQAEKYDEMLEKLGRDIGTVINIDISKEMALGRSLSRITCPKCKKIYNKVSEQMKPKVEWICDNCGVELIQRDDDKEETFTKRFDDYINKTMPLINYYESKGILRTIKANEDKNKTFAEAVEIIEG